MSLRAHAQLAKFLMLFKVASSAMSLSPTLLYLKVILVHTTLSYLSINWHVLQLRVWPWLPLYYMGTGFILLVFISSCLAHSRYLPRSTLGEFTE